MEINEFDIPVPWGHIAVKAWGHKDDTPVLVIHGIQDNAGIFDRIMPLLPKCFYYMCIDLPSHGRSSPFPTQFFTSPIDGVITCKVVLDYFDRKEYILLAHSWGAHAAVMFTQLYPEYVLKLCLIDGIYPFAIPVEMYKNYWHLRIDGLLNINKNIANKLPPSYTYEEAMNKLTRNRLFGGITKPTAECLLKRCLTPTDDGKFVFTTDPRLKVFLLSCYDKNYTVGIFKTYPIECPTLLLKASLSEDDIWSKFETLVKAMENFSKCEIQELEGNHEDFSNNPEHWAVAISKFLCKEYSKL